MLTMLVTAAFGGPMDPVDGDALYARFQDAFVHPDAQDAAPLCRTGVVMDLKANEASLTPAQRAEVEATVPLWHLTARPGADHPSVATDTCWGMQGAGRVTTEHFAVEWDQGASDEATAQEFADALETSWHTEFDTLGWQKPDGADRHLILGYISNENYAGAYTTVDNCNGVYEPYIVAGKGSFQQDNWYQDMASHELNHASQFSYGQAYEFWFWEATATYMQDSVWPSHEWWSTYVTGYTDNPWMAMNAESQQDQTVFYHMYGMAIWLFYLDQHVGGHDFARQAWEYSSQRGGYYDLTQEQMLDDLGYTWDDVYEGFMAANTVMDYADHRYYPAITVGERVSSLPHQGDGGTAPETLGQSYVHFDPGMATADKPDLHVTLDTPAEGRFTAVLVGTNGTSVDTTVRFDIEAGQGEALLEGFGDFDDVWLVVSPMADGNGAFDWTFDADSQAAVAPVDTDVPADTNGGDGSGDTPGDGVDLKGGCGCASGGPSGAWAGLGVLVVLGLRRRR